MDDTKTLRTLYCVLVRLLNTALLYGHPTLKRTKIKLKKYKEEQLSSL